MWRRFLFAQETGSIGSCHGFATSGLVQLIFDGAFRCSAGIRLGMPKSETFLRVAGQVGVSADDSALLEECKVEIGCGGSGLNMQEIGF